MGTLITTALIGLAGTLIGTGISAWQNKKNRDAQENANENNAEVQKEINTENVEAQKDINNANIEAQKAADELNYQRQLEMNQWNADQQKAQNDWNAAQIDKTNQFNQQMQRETNAANKAAIDATNETNLKINEQTNAINKQIADENLEFQKQQQQYEENLQNEIFKREDSSYQRTVADMKEAGLSPLAMSGLNGGGAIVGRTVSNNGYQAQGATVQAAETDFTQAQAAQGTAYTGGKIAEAKAAMQQATTRNAWREIAYKNDVNYMQAAGQLNDVVQQAIGNDRAERQLKFNQELDIEKFQQALRQEDWKVKVDQFNMDNSEQKNRIINAALKTIAGKLGISINEGGEFEAQDDSTVGRALTDAKEKLAEMYEENKKAVEHMKEVSNSGWRGKLKRGLGNYWGHFKNGIKNSFIAK